MSSQPTAQIIYAASHEQLTCVTCYRHLWSTIVSLSHLSSRGLIEAIEGFHRDIYALGYDVRHANGDEFVIPQIYEIFPCDDEHEAGRRWINNFKLADETGMRPQAMRRGLLKLQCLTLFMHANVAAFTRAPETPRCSVTHVPLGW